LLPVNHPSKSKRMKKTLFIITIALFTSGTVFTGCQSSAAKVENANEKVVEAQDKVEVAQQELDQAIKDSIRLFKKVSEERIELYERDLTDYRVKIAKEKNELRAKDEKRLAELEQRNKDMKKQLAEFKEERKDQWITFKTRFNRDLEAHDKAFRDFWGIKK
jgi:hypothetical protein